MNALLHERQPNIISIYKNEPRKQEFNKQTFNDPLPRIFRTSTAGRLPLPRRPIHLETQTKPVNRMPIASRSMARGYTHTVVERLDPDIGVSSVHRLARAQSNSAVYRKPRCSSVHRLSSRCAPKYSSLHTRKRIRNFAIRSLSVYTLDTPPAPECECQ